MTNRERQLIIWSLLLALFLGALDAMVMTAAMPTIIAELGGMSLYAWVYSAYFLARVVALPVFGKLSDLFAAKTLIMVAIVVFSGASLAAGLSSSMGFLVGARVFQGIGAGGIFALVYVVLSDVSLPGQRGRTLSLASAIWGISSVIGPTLGGFIVTYFSWPWIFFINLPLGIASMTGIGMFFKETRQTRGGAHLDWAGITCFSTTVLAGLTLVMTGGREVPWDSAPGIFLFVTTLVSGAGFILAERRATDPFLDFKYLKYPGFALGNVSAMVASFSIFALFAYAPLFLQGGMARSPMVVGYAMLSLSLGWSLGSLITGRAVERIGQRKSGIVGALLMAVGTGLCIGLQADTHLIYFFLVFTIVGLGMGVSTLATLLLVQDSVPSTDLGLATSFHQFSRTLGGTIGVGVCGAVVGSRLFQGIQSGAANLSPEMAQQLQESLARLFHPAFRSQLPETTLTLLQNAVMEGVWAAFVVTAVVSLAGLGLAFFLPQDQK